VVFSSASQVTAPSGARPVARSMRGGGLHLWLNLGIPRCGPEGIVGKRLSHPYRPGGERGWVKVKNRGYWRFGQKLESAQRRSRVRFRSSRGPLRLRQAASTSERDQILGREV